MIQTHNTSPHSVTTLQTHKLMCTHKDRYTLNGTISVVWVYHQLHSHFNVFWLETSSHSEINFSLWSFPLWEKTQFHAFLFRGHRERLMFLKIAERLLLARAVRVSKTGKEKAMRGCLDLQLCFHPPIHPSLYFPLLSLSLTVTVWKGRKPSVRVIYYGGELVQYANLGGEPEVHN